MPRVPIPVVADPITRPQIASTANPSPIQPGPLHRLADGLPDGGIGLVHLRVTEDRPLAPGLPNGDVADEQHEQAEKQHPVDEPRAVPSSAKKIIPSGAATNRHEIVTRNVNRRGREESGEREHDADQRERGAEHGAERHPSRSSRLSATPRKTSSNSMPVKTMASRKTEMLRPLAIPTRCSISFSAL